MKVGEPTIIFIAQDGILVDNRVIVGLTMG